MNILWVKAGGLVPLDSGGKIRSYHIARELARRHKVTLCTFYPAHANDAHPSLQDQFAGLSLHPLELPAPRSFAEAVFYARNFLSREPFAFLKYCRPEIVARVRQLVQQGRYDAIVCDFLVAAGVVPWEAPCAKVLFTHNVEALIWERHFRVTKNPIWKALFWREWRATAQAERKYLQLADHVLAVSETDRQHFSSLLSPDRITVIPTGVDVEYFQPGPGEEENALVFTGSMDWMPNEDGIFFFAENVLPLIRRKKPTAELWVVGRRPSKRMQDLAAAEPAIRLTGWVDDIRPYLRKAAVCVVPLRVGSGTRLKIFEAMAMAKATVSTTIGAEGLPVNPGEDVVIADTPEELASRVLDLMSDAALRRRIGQAARQLVETKYSWSSVAQTFEAAVAATVSASRHSMTTGPDAAVS